MVENSQNNSTNFKRWQIFTAALLALFLIGQLFSVVATKSPTMDEKTKLMLGYFPLATGEWRFQIENPPLATMFQALPLMFYSDRPNPTEFPKWDDPGWQDRWPSVFFSEVADAFPLTYDELIAQGRMMSIILTLVISALLFLFVKHWLGIASGLLVLAWLVFSPNWLAHGSLANNDLLAAGLYILSLLSFWIALNDGGWKSFLLAGLSFGAALGTKTSLLLLIPAMMLFSFLFFIGIQDDSLRLGFSRTTAKERFFRILVTFISSSLIGFLILWLIYGFDLGPWRFGFLSLPLPTYVRKVIKPTLMHASSGHASYLLGRRSMEGWWYYFPVVFFIKTPLPTLIGAVVGGGDLLKRQKWLTFSLLTFPPSLWMIAAILTPINIGYRHILPVVPFLILLIAALLWDTKITPWRIVFLCILFTWLIIGTVLLAPNYLSYFNEIAGGADNGIAWADDSNIDWGQDLELLKKYQIEEDIPFIYLSYYGIPELPQQYQINYHPFPNFSDINDPIYTPYNPPKGVYAISATHLAGKTLYPTFGEEPVGWFIQKEPCDIVGTSIFIYCVEPDPNPPQWLVICDGLESEISAEIARKKLGRTELAVKVADCSKGIFTEVPKTPGWVLFPTPLGEPSIFSEPIVDIVGSPQYVQRTFEGDPVFSLYRVDFSQ